MGNRNHFSATKGFTLIEASLGLGVAAVLGLAVFGLYRSSDASAKVRLEQAHISALAQAIESSLGIVGSFASVSVERVVEDQLVPATLLQGTSLRNAWGGSVEVAPYAFSQPNDSFAVVYGSVPAKACSDLGSALGNQVSDLKVNGQSTLLDGGVDPALLAARCNDGGTMLFVFHSGLASGGAVAATPVTNPPPVVAPPTAPPSPPSAPVAPPVISPVVVTPPVIVAPPVATSPPAPPGYAPTPGAPPPPLVVSLPAGPPATPPGNAPACIVLLAALPDVVSTRTTTPCASGRYGVVGEQRTQDWFCPDYYGNPSTTIPLTYEPWAKPAFVMTPWTQVSTTCALCPAPQTESVTQWVGASALCPAGQVGSIDWEKAQSHTRSNTVQCGTPTPAGPTAGMTVSPWSAWSTWTDTGATRNLVNSCAPATCTGASTDTRLDPRTGGCPASQTGGTSWNAEQTTSRVCNSGTWGSWAAWTDTGNTSGFVSTCTPTAAPCALPSPSTQTEPRWTPTSALCPSGQTGTHTWEFAESRSRTATCPAPTGSYTWGGWSAWTPTGATRNLVNTCAPTAPPPPPCGSWTLVNTTTSPNWASLMGEFISVNNGVTTCSAGWGWGLGVGTPAIQADRNAFAACEATRGAKPIGPNAHYEFTEYSDWGGVATNSEEYVGPATCSPPPPTMCVTRTDIQYSTVNGGDGFHELAYTLGAGGNTAYCTERDPVPQCTDILVETQLGMTFAQWSSACQVGDTWYKRSSETGHTTTEWVQEVAETFTCNVCP